ncbi:zinc finger protein 644a isoform X3 [Rhinichthys klamathensis goyatoka]|uniref:zinc finger protein 644a isoform X3 n=1 Tax=Rhinichthys klamathensis goyatoka TaxID=3034132 RepID=UPI0024B518DB|nr:zinc finger protein 644a isoform X3 [Rhinichthys klamathensis goyatoka]
MSGLKESAKVEENDTSMSRISQDLLNSETFSAEGATPGPSVHCPQETMALLGDQGDLLTSVGFMDSICSDGPAKAAYVNGSTSPHISDEILLDISKNVPVFLPKSLQAQNSVTTNVHFEGPDPLRKEGEITIRQTLTAEDVENRGIWGFDTESPESSLDNYDDGNDLSWNPQREFMKFLWDDDNGLEMEEKLSPVPSPINHKRRVPSPLGSKRRKRKEKLVLKVDPSEDLYSDLNFDHPGEGSRTECSPVKKTRSPRKSSKLKSPIVKHAKYLNGAAEAVKHLFPKPAKKPISREESTFFQRNSGFKEKSLENRQSTGNKDTTSSKPFICKECGQCYHDHSSLLNHISVHQGKRQKIMAEINELHQIKDEGKDAKLQCPQCTFGTNCPNTFVQHAKTHEKDKRYYSCNKCDFVEMNEVELRRHLLHKHGISGADLTVWKSDGFQERKVNKSTCPISYSCSVERKPKDIIGNHVKASCQPHFNEEQASSHSLDSSDEELSLTEQPTSVCKVLTSCAKPTAKSPKLSVKLRAPDKNESLSSDQKCGLLRKKKVWTHKSVQSQSRLDKSIHTLLSRKKPSDQYASECNTHPDGSSTTEFLDNSLNYSGTGTSLSPSKCLKRSAHSKEGSTKITFKSDGNVTSSDVGNSYYTHLSLEKQTFKKSPSKRKMSTPFHNMRGQDILLDFPKCRQNFKKPETSKRSKEFINNVDFMCDSNDDLRPEECEINKKANARFVRKQTSPAKASLVASTSHFKRNHSSLRMFSVKDEYKEEEISESIATVKREASSDVETDLKACPYCPAVFESGISLSNHIRGHLHRVGLKTRHSVSAAKVTSLDKVPPVRRRKLPQIKTAEDTSQTDHSAELPTDCQQTELICPLCREWFDNRTGLSNHVRGHLKRLGKPTSTASKSPVIILKELMRDKKQFQMKLQVLEKKCRATKSFHPISLNNGLTFASTVKRHKDKEEKKRIEINKGSPPSDLIGILKKRRAHEETKAKHSSHMARKALLLSSGKDCGLEIQPFKAVPNSLEEKSELNRKVCVHCNATFHSGVSLSNHLRAYAHRKKKALLDGTTYDCKQRKQRSRSGSKKKMYPLLHSPEEIYRLTCRFCDLVFQGPLSVQEDWIKHLQRHIMNTAVPHTGAGMVEVTSFPKDSCSNTIPQAQSSVMQTSS